MFHAAEAYVVERTGKVAKTHSGLRSEVIRLLREEDLDVAAFARTMKDGYRFKEIADYSVDSAHIVDERAAAAMMERAAAFIDDVEALLVRSGPPP